MISYQCLPQADVGITNSTLPSASASTDRSRQLNLWKSTTSKISPRAASVERLRASPAAQLSGAGRWLGVYGPTTLSNEKPIDSVALLNPPA